MASEEMKCEGSSIKKEPVAVIQLNWHDEVVLKWRNVTAILHFEKDGILVGKTEKEINMKA